LVTDAMPARRKIIALIEDDPAVRKALDRQVTAAGYRSHAFSCAEEFLAVATLCGAACVVSDINLGGMTGLALATHPTVIAMELPVVLITGGCDPRIEEMARSVASAFLRKPFPPGKLLEAIVDTVGPPIPDED